MSPKRAKPSNPRTSDSHPNGAVLFGVGIPQLLTLREAAAVAKVSERHFRRLIKEPKHPLRVHRFGRCPRVEPTDLRKWIDSFGAKPEIKPTVLAAVSPEVRELLAELIDDKAKDRPVKNAG